MIEEYIVKYLPTALTAVLFILNCVKMVKGLKLVNVEPFINDLKKSISRNNISVNDVLKKKQEQIDELKEIAIEQQKISEEFKAELLAQKEALTAAISKQNELLNTIIQDNVKLRAEKRRIKEN